MFAFLLFITAAPILNIEIRGNRVASPQAVAALTGLTIGQRADKPEMETACNHIIQSGFFTTCTFIYKAVQKGYSVVFELEEAQRTQTVRLEIPGLDRKQFAAREPLLGETIPNSDLAVQTYVAALQRFLKTNETPNVDIDLQHSETVIAFGEGKKLARRAPEPSPPSAAKKLVFGDLIIKGLPAFTERRVRALWTIKPGDPVSDETADNFLSEVFEAKVVPVEFQDANARTESRAGSPTADITLTFKNGPSGR